MRKSESYCKNKAKNLAAGITIPTASSLGVALCLSQSLSVSLARSARKLNCFGLFGWLTSPVCAGAFSLGSALLAVSLCFGENWLLAIMAASYTTHTHSLTDTHTLTRTHSVANLLAVSVFQLGPRAGF